jgi:hypothetical protein
LQLVFSTASISTDLSSESRLHFKTSVFDSAEVAAFADASVAPGAGVAAAAGAAGFAVGADEQPTTPRRDTAAATTTNAL